jgi:hypothetical protein
MRPFFVRGSILGLAYFALVALFQFLLVRIPLILGTDAITSWVNGEIAEKLGISSPTLDQVITFLLRWAPAALLAFICVSGWIILFYRSRTKAPNVAPVDTGSQSPISQLGAPAPAVLSPSCNEPPLPANARFRHGNKTYWGVPRRYTKDEAEDMRRELRAVYDCINSTSAPIVANYDGPAVMFTREWMSVIELQGPQAATERLDGIRRGVITAHSELQKILSRRPFYREDMGAIICDGGETGNLVGAINGYIDALKNMPEKPNANLIKLAVGPTEEKFEKAISSYSNWIGKFNTKMLLVRNELEALMA